MTRKNIILGIIILTILGSFVAYKMYNKPHINVAKSAADISVTSVDILNDFSNNETKANSKYLEKIIAVKGEITDIKIEKEKGIVTLKTNDDFGSVICHISNKASKGVSVLKVGQNVTLKGICTGFLMDVILIKCEIINQ